MKLILLMISALFIFGCSSNTDQVSQNSNVPNAPLRAEKLQDTAVHTTENQTPKPANANSNSGGKWSQSGDPIDTTKLDSDIAAIEKAHNQGPNDVKTRMELANAYFNRGFALTEARQYAAAIGDYRRALKYDPTHEESKKWVDQIVSIYQMLKKEPPKPGEEPPPLPYKKGT